MIDDPNVVPYSPGQAIARLAEIAGAIRADSALAAALQPSIADELTETRAALLAAIESGEQPAIESKLRAAQSSIRRVYEVVCMPDVWEPEQATKILSALRFPDPLQSRVQPVDARQVIATFACPARQVLTTLSFPDAPGAIGYWLLELKPLRDEMLEDYLIDCKAPVFLRVRLAPGLHHFRIQSRDANVTALSDVFDITIPESVA